AFLPRLDAYDRLRDLPAEDATSRLGIHLRFGTLSIRELVALAQQRLEAKNTPNLEGTAAWLNELVWREFFAQIMANFPHAMSGAFRPAYDAIAWETGPRADAHFAAWCQGRTGYPIVDAAMRQLAATGFMPGRLRMVTASFLIKDLGLDWRRGEAWFAEKLDDFDLAANNGNWQWVASTGCDAQPWFRIFNPVLQSRRFDPEAAYIRRWLPELARLPARLLHDMRRAGPQERAGLAYPEPLVDHEAARGRTLLRYGAAARATA
ncbi:MAG TPA: deoxyribodipyrimidine photo-lyase, partial [Ottowia sp.]|nr:deoxyribodipyrimidine photo-lyase [Ottowia sp.]